MVFPLQVAPGHRAPGARRAVCGLAWERDRVRLAARVFRHPQEALAIQASSSGRGRGRALREESVGTGPIPQRLAWRGRWVELRELANRAHREEAVQTRDGP